MGKPDTWLRDAFPGNSPMHLQRSLDEFSYGCDRRWRADELFHFVPGGVARGRPLPFRRLVVEGTV